MNQHATFEELMGELDYSMLIVTTSVGEQRAGCLVGFATQASMNPPRYLVLLSDKNRTYRLARQADVLAVHLVPGDAEDLVELFGGETGDDVDKFERCAWHRGPHDLPVLDRCRNWFVGRILERHSLGDHVGFVLEPVHAHAGHQGQFSVHRATYVDAGHPA